MKRLRWFIKTPRRAVATVALLAMLIAGGVAFAQWILSVSVPNNEGKIGSITVVGASVASGPTSNPCLPGGTCDGTITLNNTGSVPVTITKFTDSQPSNVVASSVSGAAGTCATSDIQAGITVNTVGSLSIAVPPGASTVTIPGLYTVASSLPTGCQGATFVMGFGGSSPYSVTVQAGS